MVAQGWDMGDRAWGHGTWPKTGYQGMMGPVVGDGREGMGTGGRRLGTGGIVPGDGG